MRKLFTILILTVFILPIAYSQNVQLHYDFGRHIYDKDLAERPRLTSTVEMFHPDKFGSTYFFIDMDYTQQGVASAYWEISRELKFWQSPFSAHLEYNGGLCSSFPYNNAYLVGGTYTWNNEDYMSGFTLSAMYKYIQKSPKPNSFQITGTWYLNFAKNGMCTFSGFADFWKEKTPAGKDYIFLSEPQFWLNLYKIDGISDDFKLSVGGEIELSNNFAGRDGFYAIPTLALKWTF